MSDQDRLKEKITQTLKHRLAPQDLRGHSLEQLLEEIGIYYQELEFQNQELQVRQVELEQSREEFRNLFELAPVAYVTCQPDLTIHGANRAFRQLTGHLQSGKKPVNLSTYVVPESQDALYLHLEGLKRSRHTEACRISLTGPSGMVPVRLESSLQNLGSGTGFLMAMTDLSREEELVRSLEDANRQLTRSLEDQKESKRRLDSTMMAGNLAWWQMNIQTGEVHFSRKKTDMIGCRAEDFTHYTHFTDRLHPEDLEITMEAMRRYFRGEAEAYTSTYRIRRQDGSYIWFHDIGRITEYDEAGNPLYISGVVVDVDDLRRSQQQFQDIFELSQDALLLTSPEGTILDGNRAAWEMFGFDCGENFRGESLKEFYTDPRVRENLILRLKEAGRIDNAEIVMKDRQDQVFYVLANMRVLTDSRGTTTILKALKDITARKAKELEIKNLNRELQALVNRKVEELVKKDQLIQTQSKLASLGEMISNIAHQWRQPLNALSLVLQRLRMDYDQGILDRDILARYEKKALDLIAHMSQTISDFRNFFRPDKEKTYFSLKELVQRTCSIVDPAFQDHHIRLEVVNGTERNIWGYPNEFSQAVLNILANAKDVLLERKIPDPKVRILTQELEGEVLLTLEDNGGGIHLSQVEKVFEPYFSTKSGGTGIGLYMTKMIVEQSMGGKLSVENTPEGARFTMAFPLQTERAP